MQNIENLNDTFALISGTSDCQILALIREFDLECSLSFSHQSWFLEFVGQLRSEIHVFFVFLPFSKVSKFIDFVHAGCDDLALLVDPCDL